MNTYVSDQGTEGTIISTLHSDSESGDHPRLVRLNELRLLSVGLLEVLQLVWVPRNTIGSDMAPPYQAAFLS